MATFVIVHGGFHGGSPEAARASWRAGLAYVRGEPRAWHERRWSVRG